jgi:hypothetical protein
MHQINHFPPERMTPEQRRHEIASLLANGLARLRISGAEQSAKDRKSTRLNSSHNSESRMPSSA